jgi:hypothetical protein
MPSALTTTWRDATSGASFAEVIARDPRNQPRNHYSLPRQSPTASRSDPNQMSWRAAGSIERCRKEGD